MRTLVMGVLNVTPDSFYDGGRYLFLDAALEHAQQLIDEGADVVDVGGESTRPGADPVDEAVELERVIPVISQLTPHVRVSVDTRHDAVARAAIDAGASLVNDVSSSLAPTAAAAGAGLVVMHMRGTPADMQREPHYRDVVTEVHETILSNAALAHDLGVEEVYVDPGIGFGKTTSHNLQLLRALPDLVEAGEPVLTGTSRKRFLGVISTPPGALALEPEDRLDASIATAVWSMLCGAAMVRVHDVKATLDAARLVASREIAHLPDLRIGVS